tara:strand:- start:239 stop:421 length:183 start_codon:yes stop_codon:yes gene_type:complete
MGKMKAIWSELEEDCCREEDMCLHINKEYQPAEPEVNAPESLTCEDCGADLDLPEPDDNY